MMPFRTACPPVDRGCVFMGGLHRIGLWYRSERKQKWIEPDLGNLPRISLMLSATVLTAFNDNAAITFLNTLVPGFTDSLRYTVVAGAAAGGGLTVITNAPNPAGGGLSRRIGPRSG
jgi:Na+/H+ antiporter NhaD/arsenite permease-like protein